MQTEPRDDHAVPRTLVRTSALSKRYRQRGRFLRKPSVIDAMVDVDFEIAYGFTTALIGESGSGKSTLARCLGLLEKPDGGEIWYEGSEISNWESGKLPPLRPRIQMVFQDSAGALNPSFTAAEIIEEPLEIQHRAGKRRNLRPRACELMEEVGLSPDWAARSPLEFSGGQRQRLAIARAIALKPTFLIFDESLSGLDLSTQAQILNLLLDLQTAHALSYLLISHDLTLVGQVADFVAVMHKGRMVEQGSKEQVLSQPQHPHTRELLASVGMLESAFRAARAGGGQ